MFSSGMRRGLHTRVAVVLAVIAAVLLFMHSWSNYAVMVFLLASAVGLLGEAFCIVRDGELIAKKGKFRPYIVIQRLNHPAHFWFHVCTYALLGSFSLAFGIFLSFKYATRWW